LKINPRISGPVIIMNDPVEYLRNLPHLQPESGIFSVTFRLYGSLPKEVVYRLKEEYDAEMNQTQAKHDQSRKTIQTDYFFTFDESLNNGFGPLHLRIPEIGKLVSEALHFRDRKEFNLICYCIMPNHVHLIIYNLQKPLFRILQSLKRHTALEANKRLANHGPFWQKESYDHLIRSGNELANALSYILDNPVKAGLARTWDEWDYTYCDPKFNDR
jgi:putative transposase